MASSRLLSNPDFSELAVNRPSAPRYGHASVPESEKEKSSVSTGVEEQIFDATDLHEAEKMGLKLAKDGHTILVPQPSYDPEDPLNWSWWKKHAILLIVAYAAFCGDFGSGAGIPCIVKQGLEWDMSPNKVNESGNLNVIMLGVGGLFWIPFTYWWGRAPVLFWSTFMGSMFTLGCALTKSYSAYYGLRALMGFTQSSCLTIGLAFINDMFFFHEHARKIGIWALLFLAAPYFGPLVGNFVIARYGEWRIVFWIVYALSTSCWILVLAFCDETWYNRSISNEERPVRGNRVWRVLGIWQIGAHDGNFMSMGKAVDRLRKVLFKPLIPLLMIYYALSFMWSVGINITTSILFETPIAVGGYGFTSRQVGFLYFTPLVAMFLGEAFGHFFNDYLANSYIRRHKGHFKPECRLWTNYISAIFMLPGLIIVGQGLHLRLHYASLVMGWGMYVFGAMTSSVAVTTYVLNCYPNASGEVAAFMNFARVAGGFSVGYFQMPWGLKQGYDVTFGIQAAVVAVAVVVLAFIQRYGKWLREQGGPVSF